jgi:hypothetical protein
MDRETIRQQILEHVERRGPEKTICPSEVARALDSINWRELMPLVRDVGCELAGDGLIQVTQRGQVVQDPQNARGPIRYRCLPSNTGSESN